MKCINAIDSNFQCISSKYLARCSTAECTNHLTFSDTSTVNLHIDGYYLSDRGIFISSETWDVMNYTNFAEPPVYDGNDCIAMQTSDAKWKLASCIAKLPSVCEIPSKCCAPREGWERCDRYMYLCPRPACSRGDTAVIDADKIR